VNLCERLTELKERAAIRVELTLADIIQEIEEARMAALSAETVQASAAVSASKAKAELLGLGAAKKIELGGADGGAIQTKVDVTGLSVEQLRALSSIRVSGE